jgi:hypothetical protein
VIVAWEHGININPMSSVHKLEQIIILAFMAFSFPRVFLGFEATIFICHYFGPSTLSSIFLFGFRSLMTPGVESKLRNKKPDFYDLDIRLSVLLIHSILSARNGPQVGEKVETRGAEMPTKIFRNNERFCRRYS